MTARNQTSIAITARQASESHSISRLTLARCPNCGQGYKISETRLGDVARCKRCKADFRVHSLFHGHGLQDTSAQKEIRRCGSTPMTEIMCAEHPSISARYICVHCFRPMCDACAFCPADHRGGRLCARCASAVMEGPPSPKQTWVHTLPNPTSACGVNDAPTCCGADTPSDMIDAGTYGVFRAPQASAGKKLRYLLWSYILAAWATMAAMLTFAGATAQDSSRKDPQTLGFTVTLFVFVPAIIGYSLASAAQNGSWEHQACVRSAIRWNGILIALYVAVFALGLVVMLNRV